MRPTVTRIRDEGSAARPPAGRTWRDVRLLAFAMHEALEMAAEGGRQHMFASVLSAGSLRVNSPSTALLEMGRGWGSSPLPTIPSLTICVLNDEAETDLRAGRRPQPRAAGGPGPEPPKSLEYWLEIVERNGAVRRVLRVDDPHLPVRHVLREFSL